jgi:hypothetical protein
METVPAGIVDAWKVLSKTNEHQHASHPHTNGINGVRRQSGSPGADPSGPAQANKKTSKIASCNKEGACGLRFNRI